MHTIRRALARPAVIVLAVALVGLATQSAGAEERTGAPDGPRGRNHRVAPPEDSGPLPEYGPMAPTVSGPGQGNVIPGQYIVEFVPGTPGSSDLARQLVAGAGGQLLYTYEHAIQGFAAKLDGSKLDAVRNNPNVLRIEEDKVAAVEDVQAGATWGLDRIDQRYLPLDGSYTDGTEGAGVNAYIIDTGVRATHTEFTGRMGNGYDAVTAGGTANDCHGHGTHVAGTVAGTTFGVADKARVHAVRVLDCNGSGSNSGVIAGVDWVRTNAIKPAVANMSLGGGASSTLDTAVANMIASGVVLAVAAGNSSVDACNTSPARVATAITVGATDNADNRASFSNFGTCLDLFAPGVNITSAWNTGDTATNTISGTSMASPHTAGAAALYLSANPAATPQQVRDALVNNTTPNRVSNAGSGSPNRLLYTGTAPVSPPPTSNVLVNPGFESGGTGWTQASTGGYNLIGAWGTAHGGTNSAWLGGYNSGTDSVRQTITVPTNGTLTYWWYLTSSESTSYPYDSLYVQVLRASDGALLSSVRRVSNQSARNAWYQDSVSLASWAGQAVWIRLQVTTDSSIVSDFFVDDVAVK